MKKYIITLLSAAFLTVGFSACNDDVLDRPQLTEMNDDNYWTGAENLRMYANQYYTDYFVGYNSIWGVDYAPLRGYTFSDDFTTTGVQSNFETNVPASKTDDNWMSQYQGPSWYFGRVRSINIFIDRIETKAKPKLTDEEYRHWMGIARFFRGLEYSGLVGSFGDIPYYDHVLADDDLQEMYKDRTPRGEVMDKVYDDFKYAFANVRLNDGDQYANRYVVASFIARWMLFEGTWQKYHKADNTRAKKYLEFAIEAAQYVMSSGKYDIVTDFRSLFGSDDLKGNKDCIMYRHYDAAQSVTHSIASYSNVEEGQSTAPNLSLAKAFICNDGKVYQNSALPDADKLDIASMVKTRDPRFEATFWDKPVGNSSTLLYACKFISREGPYNTTLDKYKSFTNTNDYPVMRYAEVLLSWIEAKAELATLGGAAVTQADLDLSVNKIRNRPLDKVAIDKGVTKTAPMKLTALPEDPSRDADVSALIWEIRRERRMEFVFEHSRLLDIKRWKRIEYMNCTKYSDNLKGLWINFKAELPAFLKDSNKGKLKVTKRDGTVVVYDGTNGDDMVGFYNVENASDRQAFTDRVYLSPVGQGQIDAYAEKGFTLSQNPGWTN